MVGRDTRKVSVIDRIRAGPGFHGCILTLLLQGAVPSGGLDTSPMEPIVTVEDCPMAQAANGGTVPLQPQATARFAGWRGGLLRIVLLVGKAGFSLANGDSPASR